MGRDRSDSVRRGMNQGAPDQDGPGKGASASFRGNQVAAGGGIVTFMVGLP